MSKYVVIHGMYNVKSLHDGGLKYRDNFTFSAE
jgi:hypothetical protein